MIYVYNLATSDKDQEFEFSLEVTPEWAVCYAYASEYNLLNFLFSSREKGLGLTEVFPLVCGKYSVSCGDYVAARYTKNKVKLENCTKPFDTYEIEEIEDALDISLAKLNREAASPTPHEKYLVERALTIIRGKAKGLRQ